MIKQKTVLEVEVSGRIFQLICDSDSPLGNLHDALMMMKGYTVERMSEAHKQEHEAAEKIKSIETES